MGFARSARRIIDELGRVPLRNAADGLPPIDKSLGRTCLSFRGKSRAGPVRDGKCDVDALKGMCRAASPVEPALLPSAVIPVARRIFVRRLRFLLCVRRIGRDGDSATAALQAAETQVRGKAAFSAGAGFDGSKSACTRSGPELGPLREPCVCTCTLRRRCNQLSRLSARLEQDIHSCEVRHGGLDKPS